jgi:hypothetical protein
MIKTILASTAILAATSLVAQDYMTPEQQATKCAAEGGCAIFTRDEFLAMVNMAVHEAYKQGLRACNNSI